MREQIAELTARAAAVDASEDAELGPDVRGDELPEELQRREQRLRKIQEAKARLEARQAEEDRKRVARKATTGKVRGEAGALLVTSECQAPTPKIR